MTALVDVLIPTCQRPAALSVTLTSLCMQKFADFRVVISDQTEGADPLGEAPVVAVLRLLRLKGHAVDVHKHLPRRGLAEHRDFLLSQATAPYVLFLDDDLILEPEVLGRMVAAMQRERCGFVGCAVIGLSFLQDVRPHEQTIEFWNGPVQPEKIYPDTPPWDRHRLHNAANLWHVQERLGFTVNRVPAAADPIAPLMPVDPAKKPHAVAPWQTSLTADPLTYRVAWVGGCVLYDTAKLRDVQGFAFWEQLPENHCGEDVLAQLRVMARYGGCGLLPSGVYHQELPTTVPDRNVDAPRVLGLYADTSGPAHN